MAANLVLYLALRIAAAMAPHVPRAVAYRLASLIGLCAYYLFPTARRAITENLATVLGADRTNREVRKNARRAFQNDARNWVDTLRINSLTADEILALVDVQGWEHLEAALAPGRGVILVALHLGNMDLVGQYVVTRGLPVTIPVEHMKPQRLFEFLLAQRRSKGINVVPAERAPREMLLALKRGEIVAIASDRFVGGRGIEVQLFGRKTFLPRAPLVLARHTGAAVVVGLGVRLPSNRFQGFLTPPLPLDASQGPRETEERGAQYLAAAMEQYIRRYPDQWLVFAPVWKRDAEDEAPATIEHPTGAAV